MRERRTRSARQSGAGRLRSGIGRERCCAQARCEGNQRTIRAAKDATRPRQEADGRGDSRVRHPPGALKAGDGKAGFGLGGALSFLYFVDLLCFGNNLHFDSQIARQVVDVLVRAVGEGRVQRERVDAACARVLSFKSRL